MTVDGVPAGVEPRTWEPAEEGRPARIEHSVPTPFPIDRLGGFCPEFLRVLDRAAIGLGIACRHRLPPFRLVRFSPNSRWLAKPLDSAGMGAKNGELREGAWMTATTPYEVGLDKNAANFTPLTPIGFLLRSASVYPNRLAVAWGERRES